VWLFDKVHLFGYAIPLLYIHFIIKLPVNTNRNVVLLLSALMGLCIDLFEYTLGLNMLSCLAIGFSRYYLLKLFAPRDLFESDGPAIRSFGKALFFRYLASMVFLHQVVLFTTESLSLFDSSRLLFHILGSSVLTVSILYAFESINFGDSKK
jgi:hypothetical protein